MPRKYRKLAASKDLTRLMTRYYATQKLISKVRPLAWITSGAPVEILIGMGLARTYSTVYINQSLQARAELMADLVGRFAVDGVVFHSNRSCKPYSLGQYELLERVSERTGLDLLEAR